MSDVIINQADAVPPETVTDAAVEIAEIQAERDIAIAEIQAGTSALAIEASATEEEDAAWLRGELDGLRQRCDAQAGMIEVLQSQTTMLAASMAELTTAMALLSTPPAPSEMPAEQKATEPMPLQDAAPAGLKASLDQPAAESPPKRRRRWL